MKHSFIIPLFCSLTALQAATVDYVVGKASAPAHAKLDEGQHFSTGARSSSQVSLEKGFARIGSEAAMQVVTPKGLSLEKGVMLIGSDPARRRAAVTVNAPGYKMVVKGTALVAYYPGKYVKITVLEGKLRVSLQSLAGEVETLEPGQMLIINPSDQRLPAPVEVDLNRLVTTCQLLGGPLGGPSTMSLIEASAAAQAQDFLNGNLARTDLRLLGASPEVSLALSTRANDANDTNAVLPEELSVFRVVNDVDNPNAVAPSLPYDNDKPFDTFAGGTASAPFVMNRTGARAAKWTVKMISETGENPVTGGEDFLGPAEISGTIRMNTDMLGGTGKMLTFDLAETIPSGDTNDRRLHLLDGTDIMTPPHVGLAFQAVGGISVDHATLQAGNGTATDEPLQVIARTGSLDISNDSRLTGGDITVSGSTTDNVDQTITVNKSTLTARHDITVGIPTKRAVITLENSTQLAAIVGSITIQSKGGPVTVDGSLLAANKFALQADNGTITIDALDTSDPSANGKVTLTDARMSADVIRTRGSTASGDALVIDGGSFKATSLIKFYAEGASKLLFTNNVTLTTPLAILSGQTVEVLKDYRVKITGQGRVFTDSAQFNIPDRGTLSADGGLNVAPYADKPRF
jgi:hypothetical protein